MSAKNISTLITQIFADQYSEAHQNLETILQEKVKAKVKETLKKIKGKDKKKDDRKDGKKKFDPKTFFKKKIVKESVQPQNMDKSVKDYTRALQLDLVSDLKSGNQTKITQAENMIKGRGTSEGFDPDQYLNSFKSINQTSSQTGNQQIDPKISKEVTDYTRSLQVDLVGDLKNGNPQAKANAEANIKGKAQQRGFDPVQFLNAFKVINQIPATPVQQPSVPASPVQQTTASPVQQTTASPAPAQ